MTAIWWVLLGFVLGQACVVLMGGLFTLAGGEDNELH